MPTLIISDKFPFLISAVLMFVLSFDLDKNSFLINEHLGPNQIASDNANICTIT